MGELKGDRKQYAQYLMNLNAEKISIIALTELLRVFFLS